MQKKKSNQTDQKIISLLEKCLSYGDCDLVCIDKLYDRLTAADATDVEVTASND